MKEKLEQMGYPDVVLLGTKEDWHIQIENSYKSIRQYTEWGWDIYAITQGCIYFYCEDKMDDGTAWIMISKSKTPEKTVLAMNL